MPESPLFDIPMLEGGSDYPTPDATADVAQINAQFVYMEQFLGVKPVTSGTLPSTPKTQQLVVETDTGKLKYWSGAAWVDVLPDSVRAGTTALRNLLYPAPANAAARVALANRAVQWFNTDNGFIEQYFCDDGDSATSGYNGLFASKGSGWYPMGGRLPHRMVMKTIAQNTINGEVAVSWSVTANGEGTHSSMYDSAQNTRLVAPIRGMYRVRYKARSTGTLPWTGNLFRNGQIYPRGRSADVGALGAGTTVQADALVFASADDYFELKITSTGSSVITTDDDTWFELEYVGPDFSFA